VLSFRSVTSTFSRFTFNSFNTFLSRSWVMGLARSIFSNWVAMALASAIPIQIGNAFSPLLSFKITIGILVMGSSVIPATFISMNMAHLQSWSRISILYHY